MEARYEDGKGEIVQRIEMRLRVGVACSCDVSYTYNEYFIK